MNSLLNRGPSPACRPSESPIRFIGPDGQRVVPLFSDIVAGRSHVWDDYEEPRHFDEGRRSGPARPRRTRAFMSLV